jgi:hypothetical protein
VKLRLAQSLKPFDPEALSLAVKRIGQPSVKNNTESCGSRDIYTVSY